MCLSSELEKRCQPWVKLSSGLSSLQWKVNIIDFSLNVLKSRLFYLGLHSFHKILCHVMVSPLETQSFELSDTRSAKLLESVIYEQSNGWSVIFFFFACVLEIAFAIIERMAAYWKRSCKHELKRSDGELPSAAFKGAPDPIGPPSPFAREESRSHELVLKRSQDADRNQFSRECYTHGFCWPFK